MDHKDPERHYDELESPETGRSIFWQQGEVAPDHVKGEGDFHGEGRPYRSQPNPVEDDMDRYRDMPLDGDSDDEGGNQFRTDKGVLASKNDEEDLEELDEATEPKGLGEINPVKDNDWPSGEITSRPARDEMLGSVRYASEDEDEFWDQIVEDFENAEGEEVEDMDDKVAAASWLENDGQDLNIPVEHLGWDIVDVVEPSREYIEAANKYTMPMPEGITDAVHEALIKTNAWVENPEENGKLRPYREYWSAIKPKIIEGNVQIAVEDPHMADIINHVARTNDLSIVSNNRHLADFVPWDDDPTEYTSLPSEYDEQLQTGEEGAENVEQGEQEGQEQDPNSQNRQPAQLPGWMKIPGYLGLGAAGFGAYGVKDLLKQVVTPPTMPDYSMIRSTSTNQLQHWSQIRPEINRTEI